MKCAREIVADHLKSIGADGLCHPDCCGGCQLPDVIPDLVFGCRSFDCVPARLRNVNDDDIQNAIDHDWCELPDEDGKILAPFEDKGTKGTEGTQEQE